MAESNGGALPTRSDEPDKIRPVALRVRAKQEAFIVAYSQLAHVGKAAAAAGIDRSTHYVWMKTDPQYPALFAEAEELARGALHDEAVDRSMHGWDEPVYHEGKVCGYIHRKSDRLLERLMEMKFPEFRRRQHEHTGAGGAPLFPGMHEIRDTILGALDAFPEAKLVLAERLLMIAKKSE